MKIFLVFDTCVWLNFLQERSLDVLSKLETIVGKETTIVLPSIVGDEYKRNVDGVVRGIAKSLKDRIQNSEKLLAELDEAIGGLERLGEVFKTARGKVTNEWVCSSGIAGRIKKLMDQALEVQIEDADLLKAAKRGLNKQPPFHRSKNSTADAAIMESVFRMASANSDKSVYFFVSSNTNDFSGKDKQKVHEDLEGEFKKHGVVYFNNSSTAIDQILKRKNDAELFEQPSFEIQYAPMPDSLPVAFTYECPRCFADAMHGKIKKSEIVGCPTVWQECMVCGFEHDTCLKQSWNSEERD